MKLAKLNPLNWYKMWSTKRKMLDIQQFAHNHRKYLVIIADPKDDTIFVSFGDQQVTGKIKTADGRNHNVVRRVLKNSGFENTIDFFLVGVMEVLKMKGIEYFSDFGKFIDGALFNISKARKKN